MLSCARIKYLFAIYELGAEGNEVRLTDIANILKVKKSSVSKMLTAIAEDKLIEKRGNGTIHFTEEGAKLVNQLYVKYITLNQFFKGHIGSNEEDARKDAIACLCNLSEGNSEKIASIVSLKN